MDRCQNHDFNRVQLDSIPELKTLAGLFRHVHAKECFLFKYCYMKLKIFHPNSNDLGDTCYQASTFICLQSRCAGEREGESAVGAFGQQSGAKYIFSA